MINRTPLINLWNSVYQFYCLPILEYAGYYKFILLFLICYCMILIIFSMKAISSLDKSYLIYNCLSISEILLFQLISDLSIKSCNGIN